MSKEFLKRILLVNSCLWVIAATYCVYATTYGILSLSWHRFIFGIIVLAVLTISEVVIALMAD